MKTDMQADFRQRLAAAIRTAGSSLCVGIDPDPKELPPYLQRRLSGTTPGGALVEFCELMMAASRGRAPVVKFQSAYFEAYGAVGIAALKEAMARAKGLGLLTILDAKRGDIASTMHAYGRMAFDYFQADALTVTPYIGFDVIELLSPWLKAGRGIYAVWITSNASGSDLQELPQHGVDANVAGAVLRQLKDKCGKAGLNGGFGVVLGATKLAHLPDAQRDALRGVPLLIPGVGAQGGAVDDRLKSVMKLSGAAVVAQSRSISRPDGVDVDSRTYGEFLSARVTKAAKELPV